MHAAKIALSQHACPIIVSLCISFLLSCACNRPAGVVQPMAEIGKLCRSKKVFFHTDAAQATGKIPLDVNAANIDLMSISGHKLYGPKGVGAIYIRRRPRVRLESQMSGGGQVRLSFGSRLYVQLLRPGWYIGCVRRIMCMKVSMSSMLTCL